MNYQSKESYSQIDKKDNQDNLDNNQIQMIQNNSKKYDPQKNAPRQINFHHKIMAKTSLPKVISAVQIGKNLPDHVFFNSGLCLKNGKQMTNQTLLSPQGIQCQMKVMKITPQPDYPSIVTLQSQGIYPYLNPCSKIMTASTKFLPCSSNQQDILISCNTKINFDKYSSVDKTFLPLFQLAIQEEKGSNWLNSMPPVPTSFHYSEHSLEPQVNFYATHMNGCLSQWDINKKTPTLLVSLSSMELFDVNMNRDTYAVASADGNIYIGIENCKIYNISAAKHQSKRLGFSKTCWISDYLLSGCTFDLKKNGGGILYIYDLRYIKNQKPFMTFNSNNVFTGMQAEYDKKYIHFISRCGAYNSINLHQYDKDQIHSPRKQTQYKSHLKLQNLAISDKWKVFATERDVYLHKRN